MALPYAGSTVMLDDDPEESPRARDGRAPDVFRPGGWVPMRGYSQNDTVDFVIVGTGAGGGTLACKLAEYGFSVVGVRCRPRTSVRWRISRRTKPSKRNSTGPMTASSTAQIRCRWAATTAARPSAADRPFRHGLAALSSGMVQVAEPSRLRRGLADRLARDVGILRRGRTGPEDRRTVSYPWAASPRYPYRAHPLNAAARALAKGCEAMGIKWTETPLATFLRRAALPSLRLSRLLRDRLFDQRQAERACDLDPARDRGRRGNP